MVNEPTPSTPDRPERKPYPWETDGSLDIPETPAENIEETQPSRLKSHTGLDAKEREPYPWELEASSFDEPTAPAEDTIKNLSFPWELESDSTPEPEETAQETLPSTRSETSNPDDLSPSELDQPNEKPQQVKPVTSQDAVETLRYPWESSDSSLDDLPSSEHVQLDENLHYPWESEDNSPNNIPSGELAQPDEKDQEIAPPSQGTVENQRKAWETHTAHLTQPPLEEIDEPAEPIQDAVESLRNPWESNTASLTEQPPNGHEEFNEDDFEPLPDFTDLESASESPLSNGWHREDDPRIVETANEKPENGQNKIGTSPLKRPAIRAQQETGEEQGDDEYADCVYTYTTFVTPLLKRHALTRELAQILAKSMTTVCEKNHWKLLNMTARPSGMLWTARIPPNVTTGQMVKIVREETSDMLYEIHPRLKYEALSENFWAANYLVVSGSDAPDDNSIKEFLQRIHQANRSNGSRH